MSRWPLFSSYSAQKLFGENIETSGLTPNLADTKIYVEGKPENIRQPKLSDKKLNNNSKVKGSKWDI